MKVKIKMKTFSVRLSEKTSDRLDIFKKSLGLRTRSDIIDHAINQLIDECIKTSKYKEQWISRPELSLINHGDNLLREQEVKDYKEQKIKNLIKLLKCTKSTRSVQAIMDGEEYPTALKIYKELKEKHPTLVHPKNIEHEIDI